jgi:hypothetical protein
MQFEKHDWHWLHQFIALTAPTQKSAEALKASAVEVERAKNENEK